MVTDQASLLCRSALHIHPHLFSALLTLICLPLPLAPHGISGMVTRTGEQTGHRTQSEHWILQPSFAAASIAKATALRRASSTLVFVWEGVEKPLGTVRKILKTDTRYPLSHIPTCMSHTYTYSHVSIHVKTHTCSDACACS